MLEQRRASPIRAPSFLNTGREKRTRNHLGKLFFFSPNLCMFTAVSLKEYTQPQLWKTESRRSKETQPKHRQSSLSTNTQQVAATKENVGDFSRDHWPDLGEAVNFFMQLLLKKNVQPLKLQHSNCHELVVSGKEKAAFPCTIYPQNFPGTSVSILKTTDIL